MIDKSAFNKLSYGLFVLSAESEGKHNACIINTAQQVTSDPYKITVAVNKLNFTHDMILKSGKFNVSVLSEAAEFDIFKRFGFQSGKAVNKFADFDQYAKSENGLYYITNGANSFISASVTDSVDLGTHTLFIANVTETAVISGRESATYAYYHKNIKPKPQPVDSAEQSWRCKICGYVHKGALPEDFVCPWCKHPASDFEKI